MKVTYWVSENLSGDSCYNLRGRTRREVVAQIKKEESGRREADWPTYGPIHRVTVEYSSGFDLLERCLGEGGIPEDCPGWGGAEWGPAFDATTFKVRPLGRRRSS